MKAVIYARYSSDNQREESIEGQIRECMEFAERNGITVFGTYIDRALSAKTDNRPDFQRMIKDSYRRLFDTVLVWKLDRFARNRYDSAYYKNILKKNGVKVISAKENISDGPEGVLLESMLEGLAEYYSAELSQKIRRGLHENRTKGLYSGGFIPFGYTVKDRKVYVDEDKAEIVRFIFKQYAAGFTVKNIVYDLNEKGLTKNGKPFALTTVYDILRLEKYIGICRYSDGIYTNIYPQIVPTELFNEVQMILANNKKGSSSTKADFLLKGKLICGLCGANMQGESGTSKSGKVKYYYKCGKRKKFNTCKKAALPKEQLENLIVKIIHHMLNEPKNIDYLASEIIKANRNHLSQQSVLNTLIRERDDLQKALSNIIKAIEQGLINDSMKKRMNELEEQIKILEDKITVEEYKKQKELSYENVVAYLQKAIQLKPKPLILTLIQKIVVYDDRLEIFFNYTKENNPDDTSRQDYLLPKCSTCYGMVELFPPNPNLILH